MEKHRWSGRHIGKDVLRDRIWTLLEDSGAAVGNPWSSIPDFVGSEAAAKLISQLDFWDTARVVKCNPDRAQAYVRLLALQDGKSVYTPIPELKKDFPFLLLEPLALKRKGVSFEQVMYSEGASQYGMPVHFTEMEEMDVCVVGSVAAAPNGARIGKGGGFADLEMGIFRELGILRNTCPVITTMSDLQVVGNGEIEVEEHDTPLDWIVTPSNALQTRKSEVLPRKLDWSAVREDQFREIPFLEKLRTELTARK